MADIASYCRAWRKFRERAQAYEEAFRDDAAWAIVLRFYAGLHLTQGYLASKGLARFEVHNHGERRRAIKGATELGRAFEAAYRDLQDLSESVRYDPGFVATEKNLRDAVTLLQTIESSLKPKLKRKGTDPDSP